MKAGLAAALIACRDATLAGIGGEVVVAAERQAGTAHRGFVWTKVTITGVAAHGSRPHLGADAILAAGHHLVAFDRLDQQLRSRPHPFLGPGNLHEPCTAQR